MSCGICGRSACTESFHSIEEQEVYESIRDSVVPRVINSLHNMVDKLPYIWVDEDEDDPDNDNEDVYVKLQDVLDILDEY